MSYDVTYRNGNGKGRRVLSRTTTDIPVLITGGAGFIGTNLAHRILSQGRSVILYDNLSRKGVEQNVRWLQRMHGSRVMLLAADVRDRGMLLRAVQRSGQVFHFAAQVAVTTSLVDARSDFEVNVMGTFNLLEALRSLESPPPLVYTSTNKVYGGLEDLALNKNGTRYEPRDHNIRQTGVSESRCLAFHTPYGCSKGAAEQYVLDYTRSFHGQAVVFRMSCIYGPHQFGTEDQGWVAHFLIQALENMPITIYGDGLQVRDILFIDDLVDAFLLAQQHMDRISGQPFNIGGGPDRTISLVELLAMIEGQDGRRPRLSHQDPRIGDQRYYVSDTARFRNATGWAPKVSAAEGVRMLYEWLAESRCVGEPALAV